VQRQNQRRRVQYHNDNEHVHLCWHGYANPDAATQIANGISTTTLSHDNNGNLTSAGTSTYTWDYMNRMTQAVTQGSTTTYAYDYASNRVSQTVGSTTTIYPNKFHHR
jgi:YD repeat-containing protein